MRGRHSYHEATIILCAATAVTWYAISFGRLGPLLWLQAVPPRTCYCCAHSSEAWYACEAPLLMMLPLALPWLLIGPTPSDYGLIAVIAALNGMFWAAMVASAVEGARRLRGRRSARQNEPRRPDGISPPESSARVGRDRVKLRWDISAVTVFASATWAWFFVTYSMILPGIAMTLRTDDDWNEAVVELMPDSSRLVTLAVHMAHPMIAAWDHLDAPPSLEYLDQFALAMFGNALLWATLIAVAFVLIRRLRERRVSSKVT